MKKNLVKVIFILIISFFSFTFTINWLDDINVKIDEDVLDLLIQNSSKVSKENELVKHIKKLKDKKYRDSSNSFLVEGEHLVIEAYREDLIKELIVLDEPFSGLDPINVDMFIDVINELKENGTIIIFSSHQMEHIEEFCEKLIILVKGKSILDGYVKDIKQAYKKKNIIIAGDIDDKELKKIDGVINVEKRNDEYLVKIENKDVVSKVFKVISNYDVNKFIVEEATLNEIFIVKVGEAK